MQKINEKLYNWASIIDPNAIVQAERTARLPFVERVSLMPDCHVGMGATVGSVIGTNGAICPSAVGVDIGCLDGDTEFLSLNGWVKIKDFTPGKMVLGYDPETDSARFVNPSRFIVKDYDYMYHLKSSKGLDQVVSSDHKMLFFYGTRARGYSSDVCSAEQLVEKHESLTKGLQGGFLAAFSTSESGNDLSLDEVRIQIMIAADGTLRSRKTVDNCVEMHFTKSRKIDRCKALLESTSTSYKEYKSSDSSTTIIFIPPMWTKDLTFLFSASFDQLKVAAEEAILWDGSESIVDGTTRKYFSSTNKQNADAIQYAFAATGTRAGIYTQTYESRDKTWAPCYYVIPTKNSLVGVPPGKIERIEAPDGKAYCFTVPTGFFVARRNNNIFVTGNCGMAAVHFNLKDSQLPDNLNQFLPDIEQAIPAGVGKGHLNVSRKAEKWLRDNFANFSTVLPSDLQKRALEQFGTLGSGNHFFEICLDENKDVWIVLHSGSRGLGNILASKHIKEAKNLAAQENRFLEDKDLAYFLEGDDGFALYINDMLACQDYAAANRAAMLDNALEAFFAFMGIRIPILDKINCHHNFTALERHCLTCGTDTHDNANLAPVYRKDELLSKVQDFLGGCRIGFRSYDERILLISRDGLATPPLLVDALGHSLSYWLADAQGVELTHILERLHGDHLYYFPGTQADMLTFSHSLASTSFELAHLLLDELENPIYKSGISTVMSFFGVSLLPPSKNNSISCGGKKETHDDVELWVTRKGAIKAGIGDKGIIPGSMGTRSYIVSGLGEPISFTSCSHGAGRVHSRSEAKRLYSTKDLRDAMQGKVWLEKSAKSLVDEIPNAYKNIDQVMEDQKDLVKVEHTLSQILNYKGV